MSGELEAVPQYLKELHELVNKWSRLGERSYSDGTRLVAHVQAKGVGAYLHHLFGGLQEEQIELMEQGIRHTLHPSLKEFYRFHNGCVLFDQAVFVYGLRRSYDRADFDAMACNPFDIIVPTLTHRAMSPSGRGTAICRYEDRSIVFLEPDGTICRTLAGSSKEPVNQWNDIGSWLLSEFNRLEPFFDSKGLALTAGIDTVPPYQIA